jgi:gluconokinase
VADPALAGERSPHWPLSAAGSVEGLRAHTTALDVLQALLEAAGLGLADGLSALEAYVGPVTLVASGGALASLGWRHLLADATGHPVVVSRVEEASARGAALLALECLGVPLAAAAAADDDGETVAPDPDRAARFAQMPRTGTGAG